MEWKPKHVQVLDALRTMVTSGEWQDALPGYRILENRLGVSRPTVERALFELTKEGLLAQPEPGKRRRILVSPPPVTAHADTRSLLILGPGLYHELDWEMQAELEILTKGARAAGWRIAYDQSPFRHFKNPVNRLERIVQSHRPERVVLVLPPLQVAMWFQSRGIPFFCSGGAVSAINGEIDGASSGVINMVKIAVDHLQDMGHSRILIPISSTFENARRRLLEIAATSWGQAFTSKELERLHPVPKGALPAITNAQWHAWINDAAPSAVVVGNNRDLLSLLGYCYTNGIRIPSSLSVVSLTWEPILQWIHPVTTAVVHPVEACGRWALSWLQSPVGSPRGMRIFDCTLAKGDSVKSWDFQVVVQFETGKISAGLKS